ncbi:hypothetical protein [Enterococcus lactis]|uniref:hypothetical protein n=1 Tax=Enterococcus lactis TaxID=357441 RepID=UPI0039A58924
MSDYLTAEQYEYARKTGDWESGKVLTHRQALNDNQQIVLEWLKSIGKEMPIYRMADQMKWYIDYASTGKELSHALAALSEKEEFQVLSAYAEWGLEQEE